MSNGSKPMSVTFGSAIQTCAKAKHWRQALSSAGRVSTFKSSKRSRDVQRVAERLPMANSYPGSGPNEGGGHAAKHGGT